MSDLNGFNANEVDPAVGFDPVPAGKYRAIIEKSEMKDTKNRLGRYLELVFQIIEGPFKGRNLWARLNLINKNETAVKIARAELSAICHAVGVMTPKDSIELHNLPLVVTVSQHKRQDNGEVTNEIKGYEGKPKTQAMPVGVGALPHATPPISGAVGTPPFGPQQTPGQSVPPPQYVPAGMPQ